MAAGLADQLGGNALVDAHLRHLPGQGALRPGEGEHRERLVAAQQGFPAGTGLADGPHGAGLLVSAQDAELKPGQDTDRQGADQPARGDQAVQAAAVKPPARNSRGHMGGAGRNR